MVQPSPDTPINKDIPLIVLSKTDDALSFALHDTPQSESELFTHIQKLADVSKNVTILIQPTAGVSDADIQTVETKLRSMGLTHITTLQKN